MGIVVVPPMVTAGYVVVSPTQRAADFEAAGVPDPFLTISPCLADGLVKPELSGWFQDVDAARAAYELVADGLLLALGMTAEDAADLEAEIDDQPWHLDLLRTGRAVPPQLDWRGFEIVGAESGLSLHSWHCYMFAPDAARELGIELNRDGLIDRYGEARRLREWMLGQPPEDQPAPVPWAIIGIGVLAG